MHLSDALWAARRDGRLAVLFAALILAALMSQLSGALASEASALDRHSEGDVIAWQEAVAAYKAGDYAAAVDWFRRDAETGHSRAQAALGAMYTHGQGVEKDYAEAAKWYRLGAEQGEAMALAGLAGLHEFGLGVEMDWEKAAELYVRAGESGDAHAQARLGALYYSGEGALPQDDQEAARWFQAAAEQNHARAQAFLGIMYAQGRGLPQDSLRAQIWLNIAAAQGDSFGEMIGPKNAETLSIAEQALAATRAQEWQDAHEAMRSR